MKQPLDSVMKLVNGRNSIGSKDIVNLLKTAISESKPHIRKVAVLREFGFDSLELRQG